MTDLKVGPRALSLIHHFESVSLTAYRDPVGIPTIGWGMTYYPNGNKVKMGDRLTQDQADVHFAIILARDFARPIEVALSGKPTSPAQFGALCSLAYNIGTAALLRSTVLRRHLAGDFEGAAKAFAMWNKSGGRVFAGLTRRRAAEAALYRSDFDLLAKLTQGAVK